MATSAATHPLLMATAEPTRLERTTNMTNNVITSGTDQNRQEPSKPRPRKMAKSKSHLPKKQPQRGMGVEKLERLRQDQERWTRMSEIPPQPSPPYFVSHSNHQRPSFSFPSPLGATGGVPVRYCMPPPPRLAPVSTGLGLGLGMESKYPVQRKDDGGDDHGRLLLASAPGRVMFDSFGAGARVCQGRSSKAVETSSELSSIPNAEQCVFERCNVCVKKKRVDSHNAGLSINRAMENYPEKMRVGECNFLGLNLEIPQSEAARTPMYTTHDDDDDQNVKVTAVRQRMNISERGFSMEYEFFPGKSERSTWIEGLNFPAGEEVVADADEGAGEAPNSIDLSLKLSC